MVVGVSKEGGDPGRCGSPAAGVARHPSGNCRRRDEHGDEATTKRFKRILVRSNEPNRAHSWWVHVLLPVSEPGSWHQEKVTEPPRKKLYFTDNRSSTDMIMIPDCLLRAVFMFISDSPVFICLFFKLNLPERSCSDSIVTSRQSPEGTDSDPKESGACGWGWGVAPRSGFSRLPGTSRASLGVQDAKNLD